jgi:hypothetical protein
MQLQQLALPLRRRGGERVCGLLELIAKAMTPRPSDSGCCNGLKQKGTVVSTKRHHTLAHWTSPFRIMHVWFCSTCTADLRAFLQM